MYHQKLDIPEMLMAEPKVLGDERGFFESCNRYRSDQADFAAAGRSGGR